MDELHRLETLVERRRTNLRLDTERPVPLDLVERLCRLATWAPNHKRTWPWRFAALLGEARARLGDAVADYESARGSAPEKVAKARRKYLRAPLMLAVASAVEPDGPDGGAPADPVRRRENRDAVAAGMQNLLLGATAVGLASYWGTGAVVEAPAVRELCGFGPADDIVGLVYLGWPIGEVPVPSRPQPLLHVVE